MIAHKRDFLHVIKKTNYQLHGGKYNEKYL